MRREPEVWRDNDEPEGRVVVISPLREGGYRVKLMPPMPADPPARTLRWREDAFTFARALWTRHRCGLHDLTEGRIPQDFDTGE